MTAADVQLKYPGITEESAKRLALIDEASIILPDVPMSQLCKIDDPSCESCQ